MACGGCNSSAGLTKDQVENLIRKLVESGTLQAGLKDCENGDLGRGSKVVLCNSLTSIIAKLMRDGLIKVVKDVQIVNGKLVITDGSDKSSTIPLPFLQGTKSDNGLVVTLSDGTTVEVPSGANALTKDMFGNTIKDGAIVTGKFDVDAAGLAGKGLKKDENGKLALDPATLAKPNTGENNSSTVAGSGLANDGNGGLRVVPTDFVDNETIVVDQTTGRLKVKSKACVNMTNGNLDTLSNGLAVMGQTCFYGLAFGRSETTRSEFIIGIPADPLNDRLTYTTAAQSKNDFIPDAADITGYQIASPNEVIQYFFDDYNNRSNNGRQNSGWVRIHSGGVNPDGSLKIGSWTRWERVGAIPDPDGGLSSLMNRVAQLENQANQPCLAKVSVRADDVRATMNDEMIIVSGDRTVHFNDDVVGSDKIGKQWTIVNADNGVTTLASTGTIIPPYKGSLKVKGNNAVVTVVKTAVNQYRVFGQTESA